MSRAAERRLAAVLIGGTLAWIAGAGCGVPSARYQPGGGRQGLEAWVSLSQDSTGTVRPVVVAAVPRSRLVFRRQEDRSTAGLEVRVTAWRDGLQVGGGVARDSLSLEHRAAAASDSPFEVAVPLLVRGERSVTLEVTAQVLGTTRLWQRRLAYTPRAAAAMPVLITALETSLQRSGDGGLLVPADADSVLLTIRLESRAAGPPWPDGGVALVSEISGSSLQRPRSRRTPVTPHDGPAAVWTRAQAWPVSRLPFGRLRLQVLLEAEQDGQRWLLPREPALSFVNLQVPLQQDRDWRRHLAWLDGLLPEATRDSLRVLPAAHRPQAWTDLWRRIADREGQTAREAELGHLRRIIAADDRFSGFGRGALSDRGRVLIRWGEPERIEVHPDDRVPGAVYEVWIHPAAGRRFVFYDAHGNGDFRLRRSDPLPS